MNKEDFIKVMKFISTAYNKDMTEEQLSVWYSCLRKYDIENFKNVAKEIVITEHYMPSIAMIIDKIHNEQHKELKINVEEQWERVISAVRYYGPYKKEKAYDLFIDVVRNAIDVIGWERLNNATKDELVWIKKDFINILENKVDAQKEFYKRESIGLPTTEKQLLIEEQKELDKYLDYNDDLEIGD